MIYYIWVMVIIQILSVFNTIKKAREYEDFSYIIFSIQLGLIFWGIILIVLNW